MSQIAQILNYVKNITERLNLFETNAKKVEELPLMSTANPLGLLLVSELEAGIYKSKKLQVQKIIDAISLAGQDNKVREILLGSITVSQDLNYLLNNTGINVAANEIVVLTALATVNNTIVQKQYLWKKGKGEYNPIGSGEINSKLIELQPKFINEIISDQLTNSPQAIVYDFGVITNLILTVLNTASPARNYTDPEKIYYIRATKNGVNLLYNFIGTNGIYGTGASQMIDANLVLVYSSVNVDFTSLLVDLVSQEQLLTALDDSYYYVDQQDLLKADKITTYTKLESDNLITQLLGGAPADGNTLKELNDKILAVQAIIGSGDADADTIVNTVKELLAVFATFSEGVDLVALLAGKVNTTDVYNALDSIVAGKVLDARQGKVLNDLIVALQISKENTITAGTTAQYFRGDKTFQTLNSSTVGLGSVDNTTDLNKPVSTATQTALNSKQNTLVSGTNIKTVGGVSILGAGDIALAGSGVITTTLQLPSITTETVAGFVVYLNTLATPLAVASNEIFKLQLTNSGRVFELLLRGRSFGVGQPAITVADVRDVANITTRQIRETQIPTTTNTTLSEVHNGQMLIISASVILTIPEVLPAEFTFNAIVIGTGSVAWAITAPHVYDATVGFNGGVAIGTGKYFNFTKVGNNIIIAI